MIKKMSFEYINDQSQETMQGLITTEGMLFQDEFVKKFYIIIIYLVTPFNCGIKIEFKKGNKYVYIYIITLCQLIRLFLLREILVPVNQLY